MIRRAELIEAVLDADPEHYGAILQAARGPEKQKPRMGTREQVAAVLDVHPRTVTRYEKRGYLHAVRLSKRKIRFDLNEAERLATHGLPPATSGVAPEAAGATGSPAGEDI